MNVHCTNPLWRVLELRKHSTHKMKTKPRPERRKNYNGLNSTKKIALISAALPRRGTHCKNTLRLLHCQFINLMMGASQIPEGKREIAFLGFSGLRWTFINWRRELNARSLVDAVKKNIFVLKLTDKKYVDQCQALFACVRWFCEP